MLIDPPGSSLFNAVTRGVAFAHEEAEGTRLRHPCDTITEGIGINRLTANFLQAQVQLVPNLFVYYDAGLLGLELPHRQLPAGAGMAASPLYLRWPTRD